MKIQALTNKIYSKLNNTDTISKLNNFQPKYKYKLENDLFQKSAINFKGTDSEENEWVILGYDGSDLEDIRREMRYRIFNGTKDGDNLISQELNQNIFPIQNPTYKKLEATFSSHGRTLRIFPNAQDAPDFNGIRGKTPLNNRSGNSKKILIRKLNLLKECKIDTIIDLRGEKACNGKIIDVTKECGINYVNFPIEELSNKNCDEKFLDKITLLFNTINKGNFYIGCANGEGRTDLALGLNYICNAQAQNAPFLNWLHSPSPDTNLKHYIKKVNKLVEKNPEIVKKWGWNSFEEYKEKSLQRMQKIYMHNKELKKNNKN